MHAPTVDSTAPDMSQKTALEDVQVRARAIVSLGSSAGELLRADADEAELAVPGILAVVEEGQEELERRCAQGLLARPRLAAGSRAR
jgi:hypothetical protein